MPQKPEKQQTQAPEAKQEVQTPKTKQEAQAATPPKSREKALNKFLPRRKKKYSPEKYI